MWPRSGELLGRLSERVNVIMPTLGMKGDKTIDSLRAYAPFEITLLTDTEPGWSRGVNRCLQRRGSGDVLIIDDDIVVHEHTFDHLPELFDHGDVFGFRLLYPDGQLQHDGALIRWEGSCAHIRDDSHEPSYVACVTASLCYIKASVFERVPRYVEWPGMQWEDVAFCVDAWFAGARVLYVPDEATHEESGTKKNDPRFWDAFSENQACFRQYYREKAVVLAQMFGETHRIPLEQEDQLTVPSLQ